MRLIRAWGYGACRIFPTSMPGTLRSSVYLPAPVVLPAASTIAIGFPIIEKSVIGLWVPYLQNFAGCLAGVPPAYRAGEDAGATPFCSATIAALIASYIWLYPVQRHKFPLNAPRISSSVGSGFTASKCLTVMMKPGVQKPHCAPPQSP